MADVTNGSIPDEKILELYMARCEASVDFSTYQLPQLPDSERNEVFERIRAAEASIAGPDLTKKSYEVGSATVEDELLVVGGLAVVLLTAEHGTDKRRFYASRGARERRNADWGTAGLGWVVHEDTGSALILPRGLQTKDANNDAEHKLKDEMRDIIRLPQNKGHASIHGVPNRQASALDDTKNYNVLLGIGNEPSEATEEAVEKIVQAGQEYDLRIGVNQAVYRFDNGVPRRKEDGDYQKITYAASSSVTTRHFAQTTADADDKDDYVAIQIELSGAHRLLPIDHAYHPGEASQRIGVYLGYLFMKRVTAILAASS